MFKLSSTSLARRIGVDPRLIEVDDLAIQITLVDYGHPQYAGLREAVEQHKLFSEGRSLCDGYEKISNHQAAEDGYGKALDFYAYVNGAASWQPEHLAMVGAAYLQAGSLLGYRLKWGGLWARKKPILVNGIAYGWDMPHIEILD